MKTTRGYDVGRGVLSLYWIVEWEVLCPSPLPREKFDLFA